jgi:hypothetical protein
MDLKQFEEHPLRTVIVFRLAFVFILCYVVDLAVYVFIIKSAYPTYLQGFLTSPFSPNEDYTGYYPSPEVGAIYNVGLVAFIILFTDIYFRLARPSRRCISVPTGAFVLSVSSSYLLSGIWWAFTGVPSAGTSIIGSSMVLTLCAFSGRDLIREGRRPVQTEGGRSVPMGPTIFVVASGVVYFAEYIDSSSVVPHLVGDAIFAVLLVLFLLITSGAPKRRED